MSHHHHVRNTQFWQQFFRLYRSMPELWLANSKNYRNRKLKAQSYERLLQHLRHADPNSNIHMLKRKINNLRTSYRRELRKVHESKSLGRHQGDEYVPSLWYFNELDFLYDEETGEAQTLLEADHEHEHENEHEQGHAYADDEGEEFVEDGDFFAQSFKHEEDMLVIEGDAEVEAEADADVETEADAEVIGEVFEQGGGGGGGVLKVKNNKLYAPSSNINNNGSKNLQSQRISSAATAQSTSRRRVRNVSYDDVDADVDADYEELMLPESSKRRRQMIDHHQQQQPQHQQQQQQMMVVNRSSSVEHADSECDLIGQRMAAHFRNMRPDQRLFAERIISEVLVYGRMNRLSLDARFLPNGSVNANSSGGGSGSDDVHAK
ncbi:uncharacterized protein LOC132796249 isoform X2 [Drosophila nasuta]|uniref:uncharacterized protein LOC132796249 isoform X2 n=1 Tax=Drosophila nasuta TaxID=42062 RepID=UPI00295F577E|nr:uncharacterized protein LOC132796249 isoform X2 [Drosophila nasuta]